MPDLAFQDQLPGNHCWGCGPEVTTGLRLQSFWSHREGGLAVCDWKPRPEFAAGPQHIVYGGTLASIIDCHGIWTAIATAYLQADRPIGSEPRLWYATASLKVNYLLPTPIDESLHLEAIVTETSNRKSLVSCTLSAAGETTVTADMVAVLVRPEWFHE